MTEKARLIVVDPEQEFRRTLVDELRRQGHDCDAIGDAKAALAALHGDSYDAVIVNLEMLGVDRLDARDRDEDSFRAPLIAITDQPAVAGAVRALRLGAVDYLAKPIKPNDLARAVGRALEKSRAVWGVRAAQEAIQTWTRWFRYLEQVLMGMRYRRINLQDGTATRLHRRRIFVTASASFAILWTVVAQTRASARDSARSARTACVLWHCRFHLHPW